MKALSTVARILFGILGLLLSAVRNPGATLAVATLLTGVLAYVYSHGRPWEVALFMYTLGAWLVVILFRLVNKRLAS